MKSIDTRRRRTNWTSCAPSSAAIELMRRWAGRRQTDVSRPRTMQHSKLQKWRLHALVIASSALDTTGFLSTWLSSQLAKLRTRTVITSTGADGSGMWLIYDDAFVATETEALAATSQADEVRFTSAEAQFELGSWVRAVRWRDPDVGTPWKAIMISG